MALHAIDVYDVVGKMKPWKKALQKHHKILQISENTQEIRLKGKFSSGREGALASKFNYDFK